MGNNTSSTPQLKVELYKWSSSEFPEEYALIYTSSLNEESETISTFRLSVNRDKVLCRVAAGNRFSQSERFVMKVTAERDSNGDYNFGEAKVAAKGTSGAFSDNNLFYWRGRAGNYYVDTYLDQNLGTTLQFSRYDYLSFRTALIYFVRIQCNKVKGLCVEFSGPFRYKGLIHQEKQGLYDKREEFGKPPQALIANAESDFEGDVYILFQREKGNQNDIVASLQATGLINNTGRPTQGNFNGSIFINCHVTMQHPTVDNNNSLNREESDI